ncbi:MAG: dihydropteroate synthase [Legionella sp.]|nr:MAG: dihydropteroate synthase [Legionella sp.]
MPLVMGVLNVTPDSFYDGGRHFNVDAAYDHAQTMIAAGADVLDVGGESSRPGATPISVQEEMDRVLPILERLGAADPIALSVDTCKPQIMAEAIKMGAACINDIWALRAAGALEVVAASDVPICLMHMQSTPQTMQDAPHYQDVIEEVDDFFEHHIQRCVDAGIARSRLILDPGFGFGKTVQHNLTVVNRLAQFQHHDLPILLGVSRKSTLGTLLDQPPSGRLAGGLALATYAMLVGVSIMRTHDVLETKQAFKMIQEMHKTATHP